MKLSKKRALVTGASSGIGRAVACRLAAEGAYVAVTGRRQERLDEVVSQISDAGGHAFAVAGDLTQSADCQDVVEKAIVKLEGLDILVNSAGVIGFDGILEAKPEEWRRIMDINVEAVYQLTRRAAPHIVAANSGGSIVNVSSVCSVRPYPNILGYCVSKAAVDMFTQCLAMELAPKGVRVNAVNPGVVVSGLHKASGGVKDYDAFLEHSKTTHPLGRVGQPEEIASLCLFLVSDEAGWITGGIHAIDGGRALTSAR